MRNIIKNWKQKARKLKCEIHAIYLAYKDPRTPWYARIFAACVIGYAFSPIDLIPDPVPVLGYLDDIILIPLGIAIVHKMIPSNVMLECRERVQLVQREEKPKNWIAVAIIITIWILFFLITALFLHRLFRD